MKKDVFGVDVSTQEIKKSTIETLHNKVMIAKTSGTLRSLKQENIVVPIKTKGGRVLYFQLVQLNSDDRGKLRLANEKYNLVRPIYFLKHKPSEYSPATIKEVWENEERRAGRNFNKEKAEEFVKSLTFISNVLA